MRTLHRRQEKGFTLVEMIVVMTVLLVTAFFLFDLLWGILRTSDTDKVRLNMIHDRQTAMTVIEKDVSLTSRYLTTIDAGLTENYPPAANGNAWSYRGDSSTSRVLLLRAYSTTENPLSSTRQPVFVGSGGACSSTAIYFNTVLRYNLIYFVKNGNLYRRHLVDTSTPTCTSQYQKTSCPSAVDLGTGQNANCGADDELILRNVSDFSIRYYASKTSTTPQDVYASGANPSLVTGSVDIEVSLTASTLVAGQPVSTSSSLRISKLNMDL